jgi:hypothetical protein
MSTTPNELIEEPDVDAAGDPGVVPGEDSGSPAERSDFPETDPEAEDTNAQPGQMPESTNPIVNA